MNFNLRILFLMLSLIIVGCATREAGWNKRTEKVNLSESEQKALLKEAQFLWNKRLQTESLTEALSKFELLHSADSSNLEYLIYLTRGYYFLADAHLDNPDSKKMTFEKATSFGELAMATNGDFKDEVASGKSLEEALVKLTKKEVPAMYWTAASLGKWAKAAGIATQLKYKGRIRGLVERVEKLDPTYFYSAPARYWGAFYALAPSFAGGDLNKSKTNFDKSLKEAPDYLGTKVLYAEAYLTRKGDRAGFEKVLRGVLESKADQHGDIGPENAMEKKKAEKLLEKMDDLF